MGRIAIKILFMPLIVIMSALILGIKLINFIGAKAFGILNLLLIMGIIVYLLDSGDWSFALKAGMIVIIENIVLMILASAEEMVRALRHWMLAI